MIRYIFYAGFSDYWKLTNNDLYLNDTVYVADGFKSKIVNSIFCMHNAWSLNRKKELPFKEIWFDKIVPDGIFSTNKTQHAVFAESNSLSFSRKYLQYLRSEFPNLVMVFDFSNVCTEYNINKLNYVYDLYDHIITFNQSDSEKYGFELTPIHGYSKCIIPDSHFPENDLFFVGKDKGRLEKLINIYDHLEKMGRKCLFYIVDVPKEKQIQREGIIYNQRLSYLQVLQCVDKSKCVLELLEADSNYSSIRTSEALVYRKKVITTSSCITQNRFYSPTQMLCIKSIEDIQNEFFESPICNDYDISILSPNNGLIQLEKLERKNS